MIYFLDENPKLAGDSLADNICPVCYVIHVL